MKKLFATQVLFGFLILALAGTTQASIVAYSVGVGAGNQAWTGSLGMDFTVNSAIRITELGVFDDNQDGISGILTAQIFNTDTMALLGDATFTGSGDTLIGGSRFRTLAVPIVLGPGNYTINSFGYSTDDLNANATLNNPPPPSLGTNDGGVLTFVRSRYAPPLNTSFPTIEYNADNNVFAAGTFQFTAIPEPTSSAMFGLALLGIARRRR